MKLAADEYETINAAMEYEAGFSAGVAGKPRDPPAMCKNRISWLTGFDDGKRAKERSGGG